MPGFDLEGAFQHLHDRFDRMEDNVQEVRDKTIETSTSLKRLVGNGHPGEFDKLHERVTALEGYKNRAAGLWGGVCFFATALVHFGLDWLRTPKH